MLHFQGEDVAKDVKRINKSTVINLCVHLPISLNMLIAEFSWEKWLLLYIICDIELKELSVQM